MYNNFAQFFVDILPRLPAANQFVHANRCWQVYQNARDADLNMLAMGRLNALGNAEINNLGATNTTGRGSILRDANWSIQMNDAWVLGGIHGLREFHLASATTDGNIINMNYQLHQDPEMIFTVTGRELFGLTTCGYSIYHESDTFGTVLTCTQPNVANRARFQDYWDEVRAAAIAMTN
ncbi:hypothetical protein [Gallaecimonas mangrovi]|uniref:hypothetical protein n=1 Tax=Gallaecimonas mangrovi TaxID=2291597 RepID=UPI000E209722|nr:hypothetical protein [Gallaecimonas mangrovi]